LKLEIRLSPWLTLDNIMTESQWLLIAWSIANFLWSVVLLYIGIEMARRWHELQAAQARHAAKLLRGSRERL
jgi:hypothetical protein